jgi:hypothetical protein
VSSMADVLPWWMKLLIVSLLFSTGLTVYQLNGRPFYALLAGAAGILSACAEMNWLPGGSPSVYPVLAFSLPVLILVPWLPRLHLSQSSLRKLGILVALIAASGWFWSWLCNTFGDGNLVRYAGANESLPCLSWLACYLWS